MKTLTNVPSVITTAIFGALSLSCGPLSIAADVSGTRQVVVKFEDLNLSNSQGATSLYTRIVTAAHAVCRSVDIDIASRRQLDACVHKAITDAVTKVGQPELFAIYNTHNRQVVPITLAAVWTR